MVDEKDDKFTEDGRGVVKRLCGSAWEEEMVEGSCGVL